MPHLVRSLHGVLQLCKTGSGVTHVTCYDICADKVVKVREIAATLYNNWRVFSRKDIASSYAEECSRSPSCLLGGPKQQLKPQS
jgi:hypothetical protein